MTTTDPNRRSNRPWRGKETDEPDGSTRSDEPLAPAKAPGTGPVPGSWDVVVRWFPAEEREAVGPLWLALEQGLDPPPLTNSWLWTQVWLEAYGDLVPHRFAVGEVGGTPCGVVLVTRGVARRRGPFAVRTVHLGTAGEPPDESVYVEYNRVLVEPRHRHAFAAALVEELRRDPSWHELHLDGFAPEDAEPFLAAEPALEAWRTPSPSVSLQQPDRGDGTVLAMLRPSTRYRLRRSLSTLGDVDVEWAETAEQADDVLTELIELHQRRWTEVGQPGAFASARFVDFHRRLVARALPSSRVILFRARSSSGTVGCLYNFVEGDRVLSYLGGYSRHPDRRVAPGFVTMVRCLEACQERGYSEFDFLAGEGEHKRELSNVDRELVWATARRPALRWTVLDALRDLRGRARGAWQALPRARALTAAAYRVSTRPLRSEAAVEVTPGTVVPRFVVEWAESEQRNAPQVLDRFGIPGGVAGRAVLVVGRGAGDLALEVAVRGARRVVARDMVDLRIPVTERALAAREEALPVEVGRFEAGLTDLGDDRFDLVIARDAFRSYGAHPASRHVEERVSDMASRLAPGGLLAVEFGPPWKAFDGGMLESRVPWAHLLFPEDVVFEEFRRVRPTREARSYEDIGVNRITLDRFRRAMEATGLECLRFQTNPSRRRLAAGLRAVSRWGALEEYLTFRVCGVWRRS